MSEHSLLNTNFPVFLPEMPELRLDKAEFEAQIKSYFKRDSATTLPLHVKQDGGESKDEIRKAKAGHENVRTDQEQAEEAPFMKGLLADKATMPSFDERDDKMLTANADVAYRTTGESLVDLFYELDGAISREVLEKAWSDDPEATLKIIWNARSIHLGKSSRSGFYRAVGWLAENHPMTLLTNLPWLVRPVIQKKVPKKDDKNGDVSKDTEVVDAKDADSDFEIIEEEAKDSTVEPKPKRPRLDDEAELSEFDVKYGVAHGYWKDLLNMLALAANDQLKLGGDVRSVLNVEKPATKKYKQDWTEGQKKGRTAKRHDRAVKKLEENGFYKALHLSVARLFAMQLRADAARLNSNDKNEKRQISFAAKWAPTHKGMHDQHTCIVTSIAELLHPFDKVCPEGVDPGNRELYLKHARIAYQSQTLSPLRKHLEIVEHPITTESFSEIKYDRVPSLAMKQHTPLFAKKDFEHFDQYIEKVASGKAKISGATLLPSTLVAAVLGDEYGIGRRSKTKEADRLVQQKLKEMELKVVDGQWNTLVQRIKDSGTLQSSIAVCDVSGSMGGPTFPDGTNPMCSSIGLSLILAEITKPPFGGAFITFHEQPSVLCAGGPDDKRTFTEKVKYISSSPWGGNTDFVAVFEKLILPMAIEHKLTQEDMVKQVFVFSDMQFDMASRGSDRWTTSFERIQRKFKDAGYEMPKLIFWNLAGGRAGYQYDVSSDEGDDTAPKPVNAAEENTALVSGYSQGQMKMFLENGSFDEPEEEGEQIKEEEGPDGEVVVNKEKKKQDPLAQVKKAISHDAYRMLKVVD